MKTTILFLLILLTTSSISIAQQKTEKFNKEKLIIELKYGKGSANTFFKSNNVIQTNHFSHAKPNYSFSLSGKLYKCFYLKTEMGYTQIEDFIEAKFKYDSNYVRNLFNWYEAGYFYLSILPELRIEKDYAGFYINGGPGFFSTTSTRFLSAINNNFDAGEFRSTNFAWVSNAGISIKYNGVGLVAGAGFKYVTPQNKYKNNNSSNFGLGFKQWSTYLGVSYSIK